MNNPGIVLFKVHRLSNISPCIIATFNNKRLNPTFHQVHFVKSVWSCSF